jgi:dTDP-glucose 4,6-dehydratase
MKLLVTGGAGFIGSNFIRHILKKYPNYQIINLDLLTYAGNLENLKEVEKNSNYKFVQGNICDRKLVDSLIPEIDTVVHFAAESHVDRSILDSHDFIQTNIIGTHTLLESAKSAGWRNSSKRFHHISTDEVFGSLELNWPSFTEKNPYDPRSPYSASKASSDHLVRAYFHTHNLPITISNCSNNYGPYHFPEKFIPLIITNLLEDKKIPLYGNGLNVRDWLFVEDHCEAIDLIIHEGKIGETYCILEIAKKILELMGKKNDQIEYVTDRPGHDKRYSIDFSKIKEKLEWQPKTNFEAGLQKTIDWYKNNENWWKNIKNGEYRNYYAKQYGKV